MDSELRVPGDGESHAVKHKMSPPRGIVNDWRVVSVPLGASGEYRRGRPAATERQVRRCGGGDGGDDEPVGGEFDVPRIPIAVKFSSLPSCGHVELFCHSPRRKIRLRVRQRVDRGRNVRNRSSKNGRTDGNRCQ